MKIVYIFFALSFIVNPVYTQLNIIIEKIDGEDKYRIGDKIGELHDFENEFMSDYDIKEDFLKFNRNRKGQVAVNYLGLVSGCAVMMVGYNKISTSGDGLGGLVGTVDGLKIVFWGALGGGLISGFGNAWFGPVKSKYKKKLLRATSYSAPYKTNYKSSYISMSINGNGLGLIYHF